MPLFGFANIQTLFDIEKYFFLSVLLETLLYIDNEIGIGVIPLAILRSEKVKNTLCYRYSPDNVRKIGPLGESAVTILHLCLVPFGVCLTRFYVKQALYGTGS